ncbi:hypothetical protein BZH87_07615 [Salmonella enterica]|uniref:hypothetical protein n=1 Tax=Salmonella enterica TaxID=28901 RepID=UPI000DA2ECDC|nr:hypothetical protein [Salmonella enterica]ECG1136093.1 hypothetical protein [Salmonella enterica subsp. enterica]ECI4632857.1 hypothetical protein [Salmonella enterica subsp. enterica serovar Hartford]ECM4405503.1 hypothetical protein [Salmonella enterica subsp. enterica serovar Give]ECT8080648.1 hypothetical protein [Salmonella enterica subsp. enterica serovar Carrau]EAA2616303.1 hypothetical protein [Salmonella enterica]
MTKYRKVLLLCLATQFIFVVSLLLIPVIDQYMLLMKEPATFTIINGILYDVHREHGFHQNIYLQSLIYLFRDLILAYLLWQTSLIFRALRLGKGFFCDGSGVIYKIGAGFVSYSIFLFISDMVLLNYQHDGHFIFYYQVDNLLYLPLGCAIMIFGYVLEEANKINEEQKLVI